MCLLALYKLLQRSSLENSVKVAQSIPGFDHISICCSIPHELHTPHSRFVFPFSCANTSEPVLKQPAPNFHVHDFGEATATSSLNPSIANCCSDTRTPVKLLRIECSRLDLVANCGVIRDTAIQLRFHAFDFTTSVQQLGSFGRVCNG